MTIQSNFPQNEGKKPTDKNIHNAKHYARLEQELRDDSPKPSIGNAIALILLIITLLIPCIYMAIAYFF